MASTAGLINIGFGNMVNTDTVSYTHLDVYKRQLQFLCTFRKPVAVSVDQLAVYLIFVTLFRVL